MHREVKVNTPSLSGGSELLVMAPIKPGFVPSLESVTYKTRVKTLLRLLHVARSSSHEYRLLRAVSDAVERVGVIHTLRVAVIEGENESEDKVLLSVNFDGAYEAYVRVIWQKASRLLDLIFCNTVGYPTGWDHSYDVWSRWLRSVQVETPFFYATPGVTYQDQNYLRMLELRDRGTATDTQLQTRIRVPTAEEIAWTIVAHQFDPVARPADPTDPAKPATGLFTVDETIRQSLQGLAGIYRLADLYRERTDDGVVLLRAARELLPELAEVLSGADPAGQSQALLDVAGQQLARPLEWFDRAGALPLPDVRKPPALGDLEPAFDRSKVQGGIVREFDGVTDGCLCLVRFENMPAAAAFLRAAMPTVDDAAVEPDKPLLNVAFTAHGLRACGLTDAQLDWFPIEFRSGMAARAGLLGDVRTNHPRRWELPLLNWPAALAGPDAEPPVGAGRVALDDVHAVLQLRVQSSAGSASGAVALLATTLGSLLQPLTGVQALSLQWMQRLFDNGQVVDHFGFTDGQSQPRLERDPKALNFPNQVQLGEVLVGFDNAADHESDLSVNQDPEIQSLMRGGSFLVVRKLRQNVAALDAAVQRVVDDDAARPAGSRRLDAATVLAHMVGRWPANSPNGKAGAPLSNQLGSSLNDFDYLQDPDGQQCPLGAHMRRANPRDKPAPFPTEVPGGRMPRIMRRSLPYGPAPKTGSVDADRGLIFMAYGASLAEQFEVVQRWLAGGNSSRGYSGTSCPLLGVPESGRKRDYRFEFDTRTVHMHVDGSDDLGEASVPLVTLLWGLYAFAPSEDGRMFLLRSAVQGTRNVPWSAADGLQRLARLRRVEAESGAATAAQAWKAALEDAEAVSQYDSASIWAAIRAHCGGVLRMPYGVLVASNSGVAEVLEDVAKRYTVAGYQRRLEHSIGPIFLGMDKSDPEYARQSAACNAAIQAVSYQDGFEAGRTAARNALTPLRQHAIDVTAQVLHEDTWELSVDSRDIIESALAELCERWFGLLDDPQAGPFTRGGFDWHWTPGQPVYYPGHFTSVSRATFQPLPSDEVAAISAEHGKALAAAMLAFLQANHTTITAPISRAVLNALWVTTPEAAARTITGAMMGILPTTEGVLRRLIVEWTSGDQTLLSLRAQMPVGGLGNMTVAKNLLDLPLRQTMMLRPVPEQIWRKATVAHALGSDPATRVHVAPGDTIILGLVSATQGGLAHGGRDVFPIFGGDRSMPGHPPTHACPGYEAAMGVMLGVCSALLDFEGELMSSPAPGVLVYSGNVASAHEGDMSVYAMHFNAAAAASKGELIGYGDSWIYNFAALALGYSEFQHELALLGFNTTSFRSFGIPTRRLAQMLDDDPTDGNTVYGSLRGRVANYASDPTGHPLPVAILLSGGGNDVKDGLDCAYGKCALQGKGSPLDGMLNPYGAADPVDAVLLKDFLNQLTAKLTVILQRLCAAVTDSKTDKQLVPVVVHAYDHPFPDGVPSRPLACAPLQPTFLRKSYPKGDVAPGHAAMRVLIDGLNDAYEDAVEQLAKKGARVHFVRLAGTLEKADPATLGHALWANELHPNRQGFACLAQVLANAIDNLP